MQSGLQAILYCVAHDEELRDRLAILLMHFGKHNPMELFTDMLQSQLSNWTEYATFC
jgi:hypothetical protein